MRKNDLVWYLRSSNQPTGWTKYLMAMYVVIILFHFLIPIGGIVYLVWKGPQHGALQEVPPPKLGAVGRSK